MDNGIIVQSYKIAGQPYFKCELVCERVFHQSVLPEVDFLWASDPDAWKKHHGFNTKFKITKGKFKKSDKKKLKKVKK